MQFLTGSPVCPIQAFHLYLEKLNAENNNLWQRPKARVTDFNDAWFDNAPVGAHTLGNFMKKLSKHANLSTEYTNHSIRATVITALDQNNIEARHICGISGHRSEETIRSYSKRCPSKKKREMADIMSEKLGNPPPKKCKPDPKQRCDDPEDPPNQAPVVIPENAKFEDWVPIENNKDDFVLSQIISEIEKENADVNIPQLPNPDNSGQALVPMLQQIATTSVPNMQAPKVLNFSQAQNFPVVPKMYFPNSNVTINYNFKS